VPLGPVDNCQVAVNVAVNPLQAVGRMIARAPVLYTAGRQFESDRRLPNLISASIAGPHFDSPGLLSNPGRCCQLGAIGKGGLPTHRHPVPSTQAEVRRRFYSQVESSIPVSPHPRRLDNSCPPWYIGTVGLRDVGPYI